MRLRKEEEEKKKLGELIAWQKNEEAILASMVAKEDATRASLREKQAMGQYLEIDELQRISLFLKKIARDIVAQREKLVEIARQIEIQREALVKAVQEKKILETLKENQYNEWLAEVEAEEAKVLDELATLKYAREGYAQDD